MPNQSTDQPKILIETADGFGGKRVQSTTVDTNRHDPFTEFALGWAELLRLPDTLYDLVLQCGCWLGLGSFSAIALVALDFPALLTYPAALVSVALLIVGGMAAKRNLLNAFPLVYRCALALTGATLALWGAWS
jgi:hypothetical protein